MKVLLAIDSFKGSLSSAQAGCAAAEGIRRAVADATCVVRPLADGGEGTVTALVDGLGGVYRQVWVSGPMGGRVLARYGILPDGTTVMEMAEAAGITHVPTAERNPRLATTYGVGEMIVDAMNQGAKKFVIGIGGSATNDGGAGMLQALGYRLLDAFGNDLPHGGAALADLSRIEVDSAVAARFAALDFKIACDVTIPLCGPCGTTEIFGPQKGATPDMVAQLDAALAHFAAVTATTLQGGQSLQDFPGVGAAGGLGYAFKAFLGAELVPGVDLILSETRLELSVQEADVVVTGEGRLDGQSVMGKAPIGVARLAKRYGKRVIAFCGCVGAGVEAVNDAGIDAYFPILRGVTTLESALDVDNAAQNLSATAEQVFRLLIPHR